MHVVDYQDMTATPCCDLNSPVQTHLGLRAFTTGPPRWPGSGDLVINWSNSDSKNENKKWRGGGDSSSGSGGRNSPIAASGTTVIDDNNIPNAHRGYQLLEDDEDCAEDLPKAQP